MLSLSEATDTVRRRCRYFIASDNINKIYIRLSDDSEKARVIVILNDNLNPDTLTRIAVRYTHLFDDLLDTYTFEVLGCENHFKKDDHTYVVWRMNAGFITSFR